MDGSFSPNSGISQRETALARYLSDLADHLDISETDYDRARSAYQSVSEVVTDADDPALAGAEVFLQGSFATRTVVRPADRNDGELDVDLACRLASSTLQLTPKDAMALVGYQLMTHGRYHGKVKAKTRCWRVQYENAFHLDICPLVRYAPGAHDAIPDRKLDCWVPTAPQAYAAWFNQLADTLLTSERERQFAMDARADIAPFPNDVRAKGWLRRTVQLLKRHRDQWASSQPNDLGEFAPISIILTTLAARVIERHLAHGTTFLSAYAVVRTIIEELHLYVKSRFSPRGQLEAWVASPVAEENFANRWAEDPKWQMAFTAWHQELRALLPSLAATQGLDTVGRQLGDAFGPAVAQRTIDGAAQALRRASANATLGLGPAGLVAVASPGVQRVSGHTFFGLPR